MELDIDVPFGEMYKQGDVRRVLDELYRHVRTRQDAQYWARNLRFLTPAAGIGTGKSGDDSSSETDEPCSCNYRPSSTFEAIVRGPEGLLQVTKPDQLRDCNHYAAISWVWQGGVPPQAAVDACERYIVASEDRESWIPHHIISRAISFAAHYELSYIWFDKECIDQEHSEDKELGIQAMDIVYQRSLYPVALLQALITTQHQLDLFYQLVEGINIPAQELPALLELLQLIEGDKYFTRAWCLQESISGGLEMHVLIPHEPNLSKPETLGTIPGEVETSISELMHAVDFAYACVSLCDEPLDAALESQLYQTIDRILSFTPIVIDRPAEGFDNPDYRQTCNAAEALTFLQRRHNHRVADRIAILGNICDYRLRLDTNAIEDTGFGFSICAFALATFNGDLSLSQSHNLVDGGFLDYSWGPRKLSRLSQLQYFEDGDLVVRANPARYTGNGLIVQGWLWRVEEVDPGIAPSGDQALLIWSLLKYLLRRNHTQLAQIVWRFSKQHKFGTARGQGSHTELVPSKLEDVLAPDSELIYRNSQWIQSENDFRNFFEVSGTGSKDARTIDQSLFDKRWEYNRWLWTQINSGSIGLAKHEQQAAPSAIFNLPVSCPMYVFQPSTVLDQQLATTQRRNAPIFWIVDVDTNRDEQTGHRIVKGTGKMCNGYFDITEGQSPETFVFA